MEITKVLSQSAIGQLRLTIPGGGPAITVALPALELPQDLVIPFRKQEPVFSNWQKSFIPVGEPGTLTLSATLGERIGGGRTGVIFPLEDIEFTPCPSPDVQLPSFVIKVGRPNRCAAIIREAWFYEKLGLLQGVSIARFYGCFETELPEDSEAYAWKHKNLIMTENLLDQAVVDKDLSNRIHPHKWLRTRCYNPDIFSCLLLERLGGVLSRGQENWQETKVDIEDVYRDICSFGVQPCREMTRYNILKAPESPPGLPSLPSYTGRRHAWRHVDLELASLPDSSAQAIHDWCVQDLETAVYPEAEEPEPSFELRDPQESLDNALA